MRGARGVLDVSGVSTVGVDTVCDGVAIVDVAVAGAVLKLAGFGGVFGVKMADASYT